MLPFYENLRDREYVPRVHPNGFIQLDLEDGGGKRLHVWDRSIPRQGVATTTHDHIFLMRSTVYRGVLGQVTFNVDLDHGGSPTDEIWMANYASKSESVLVPTGVKVHRMVYDVDTLHGDNKESYTQTPFTFHESVPIVMPVVTIMTKVAVEHSHDPRVLVPIGLLPDNDFKRTEHDVEFLWSVIREAIA